MNEEQTKEVRQAFKRVFDSDDGKTVKEQLEVYKQGFVDTALNAKNIEQQTVELNRAAGVNEVLKFIDGVVRAAEADNKKKEAEDRQKN